jgi:hypothetical protein
MLKIDHKFKQQQFKFPLDHLTQKLDFLKGSIYFDTGQRPKFHHSIICYLRIPVALLLISLIINSRSLREPFMIARFSAALRAKYGMTW